MLKTIIGDGLIALAFGIPVMYLGVGELLHQYALHHDGHLPQWLEGPPAPKDDIPVLSRTSEPEGETSHD